MKALARFSICLALTGMLAGALLVTACENVAGVTKGLITYTAAADNETNTTAIDLVFSGAVAGLTADDIAVTNDTGSVTKEELTGSGTAWSLGITAEAAGHVAVSISKAGIEATEKSVAVYKAEGGGEEPTEPTEPEYPENPEYTAAVSYYDGDYSSGTGFDESKWAGAGTAQESWALTATEQHAVYFAVYKKAEQTISVSGDDAAKVSAPATDGTVGGVAASDTRAVFAVKTGDLAFDGGTRTFTLNVNEEGYLPRSVSVSLDVGTNLTGAAVFRLIERVDNVEYLTRLDTGAAAATKFVEAFTWVENNAEADTEYIIRVEKDELNLPHLIAGLNEAENVTLKLKGTREGPWILEPEDVHITSQATIPEQVDISDVAYYASGAFLQIGGDIYKDIYKGVYPKRTFILGNNITIKSGVILQGQYTCTVLIDIYYNATLVLEPGSEITGHNNTTTNDVIRIRGLTSNTNKDPTGNGHLRIEGGAITDCTLGINKALIRFLTFERYTYSGSFYLAGGNALTLSGNTSNLIEIDSSKMELDVVNGMSLPSN